MVVQDRASRHFRLELDPFRALSQTAGEAKPMEVGLMLRYLMKSCAYLARYLRQDIEWVERMTVDEMHRWLDVVSEILKEERGGSADREHTDPFQMLMSDD